MAAQPDQIIVKHDGQQAFCATKGPIVMGFDPGPYNFTGTCESAPPPPGTCNGPAGLTRITRSNVTYGAVGSSARINVDLTEWNNIWGHGTNADAVTPWPGVNGAGPVIRTFARRGFLAAHFNTGSHGVPTFGVIAYASNIGGPDVDIRISRTCGDFSADTANPACLVQAASDDSPAIRWKFGAGNTGSYCNLTPNTDYYINVKYHEPASPIECPVGASACPFYTVNNGNW
jgi:hypothetical protein